MSMNNERNHSAKPTLGDVLRFMGNHKIPFALGVGALVAVPVMSQIDSDRHEAWANGLPPKSEVKPGSHICLQDNAIFRSGPDPLDKNGEGYVVVAEFDPVPGKETEDMVCFPAPNGVDYVDPINRANPPYLRVASAQQAEILAQLRGDAAQADPIKRQTKNGSGAPADPNSIKTLIAAFDAMGNKVVFTPSATVVGPNKPFPQKK